MKNKPDTKSNNSRKCLTNYFTFKSKKPKNILRMMCKNYKSKSKLNNKLSKISGGEAPAKPSNTAITIKSNKPLHLQEKAL